MSGLQAWTAHMERRRELLARYAAKVLDAPAADQARRIAEYYAYRRLEQCSVSYVRAKLEAEQATKPAGAKRWRAEAARLWALVLEAGKEAGL